MKSRIERQRITRECLLKAARILIIEQGYQKISILDIVQKAGFSKGAFFPILKLKKIF